MTDYEIRKLLMSPEVSRAFTASGPIDPALPERLRLVVKARRVNREIGRNCANQRDDQQPGAEITPDPARVTARRRLVEAPLATEENQ